MVVPLSDIQPPFDINFAWRLVFRHSRFCMQPTNGAHISNLQKHSPLRVPIYTLVRCTLGDSFLVPREIHVRSVLDSNLGTLYLHSNAPPLDQHFPTITNQFSNLLYTSVIYSRTSSVMYM